MAVSLRGRFIRHTLRKHSSFNSDKNNAVIDSLKPSVRTLTEKPVVPKGYERKVIDLGEFNTELYTYTANEQPIEHRKLLLYHHGGAYIAPLTNLYRRKLQAFSDATDHVDICLPDYRVAPEHVYPAQAEDALKNWDYLIEMGYSPANIVVCGDSAGGNMTLTLLLRLRDMGRALPRAMALLSPWGDSTCSGETYYSNYKVDAMFGSNEMPTEEKMQQMLDSDIFVYCRGCDRSDPYVSPVYGDYNGFPPTFISVGGDEVLLSDSLTIADKLQSNDVPVKLIVTPGMFHIFPLFSPLFPEAKKVFGELLTFVGNSFKD